MEKKTRTFSPSIFVIDMISLVFLDVTLLPYITLIERMFYTYTRVRLVDGVRRKRIRVIVARRV